MTRRGLILFAALGIAWGIPYLFIKIAVSELDPAMVVLGRSALAAILLLPLAFFRREVAPVVRRWKPMLAYTIVEIILPWYFLSSAEQRLPSSTAGLLLATVPLAGVGIAFAMGRPERLSRLNWLGITLGMLGVAALVGLDIAGSDLIAVAEMAVVVVGYALGPAILARWMSDLPGVGVVAVSLAATAVVYVPFVLFARQLADRVALHGGHRLDHRARRGLQRPRLPAHGRPGRRDRPRARRRRSPTSIPRSRSSRACSCSASGSPCGRSSDSPSCSPGPTS